jgi:hypothetical protein
VGALAAYFATLSKPIFPFETPMAFSTSMGNQGLEINVASIFGDKPCFRFRYAPLYELAPP